MPKKESKYVRDNLCIAFYSSPYGKYNTGDKCDEKAEYGQTGVKCYCEYHWLILTRTYEGVKIIPSRARSKNRDREYKKIKNETPCRNSPKISQNNRFSDKYEENGCDIVLNLNSSPQKYEKSGKGFQRPKSPGTQRTPIAGTPITPAYSPGVNGKQFITGYRSLPPANMNNFRIVKPQTPKSSNKSKKMEESDSEASDSDYGDEESESDIEGASDSEVSDSDSDSETNTISNKKYRVTSADYGKKDKKIPNYNSVKITEKGLKTPVRVIRGRNKVVRYEEAPFIRIDSKLIAQLEKLDTTEDVATALDAIKTIKTNIEDDVKNKKFKDEKYWSVEESVINYISEKLAPYIYDTERLELLMTYLFEYDRRIITHKFSQYGFTTDKDFIEYSPYSVWKYYQDKKKIIPYFISVQLRMINDVKKEVDGINKQPAGFIYDGQIFGDVKPCDTKDKGPGGGANIASGDLRNLGDKVDFETFKKLNISGISTKIQGDGNGIILKDAMDMINNWISENLPEMKVLIEFKEDEALNEYTLLGLDTAKGTPGNFLTDIFVYFKNLYENIKKQTKINKQSIITSLNSFVEKVKYKLPDEIISLIKPEIKTLSPKAPSAQQKGPTQTPKQVEELPASDVDSLVTKLVEKIKSSDKNDYKKFVTEITNLQDNGKSLFQNIESFLKQNNGIRNVLKFFTRIDNFNADRSADFMIKDDSTIDIIIKKYANGNDEIKRRILKAVNKINNSIYKEDFNKWIIGNLNTDWNPTTPSSTSVPPTGSSSKKNKGKKPKTYN